MKDFIEDLWKKLQSKLVLLIGFMVLVGGMEGLGLLLLLPFITLLSGASTHTHSFGFITQYTLSILGTNPSLTKLTLLIMLFFACQAIISMFQGKLIAELESNFVDTWRHSLLNVLLQASWSFFVENKTGQLLFTFETETERLGRSFLLLTQIMSTVILLVIYFLIAIYLSWQFSLVLIFIGMMGFLLITRNFARKAYATGANYAEHNKKLLGHMSEFLSAIKMIKATNSENRVLAICTQLLSILKRDYFSSVLNQFILRNLFEFFIIICMCGSLAILHHTGVAFASIVILMAIFLRILPKLHSAQSSYQLLLSYLPSFKNVTTQFEKAASSREILLEPTSQTKFESPVQIQFENVSMCYGQTIALNNISFEVQPGTICAIVGASGAGKSTLVDLIVKIIQPAEGMLRVNGNPLQTISTINWRRSIGYVTQEPLLLHDTVWNNITWVTPNCSKEDVFEASILANAHSFIQNLSEGYQTIVGEKGSKLSGGQRQRIALARALITKPQLLILDEATSALDVESEQVIIETLCQLRGKLTILLISHRFKLVHASDQVILLEKGSIIESGKWSQLISNAGRFADLWSNQQMPS